MRKDRIGEIKPIQAEKCVELKCPLFNASPYPMCTIKAQRAGDRNIGTLESIVKDYKARIPAGCPKEYDQVHPTGGGDHSKPHYTR